MKKILVGLMIVAMGLLLMSPVASAYPVAAGDLVKITLGLRDGSNNGGAFNISIGNGPILFDTFCLETNEYFTPGNSYYIGSITGGARSGGVWGGNPDPISSQTAYLYSSWATEAITHTATNASALQLAIWKYEDELPSTTLTGLAKTYYDQAASASGLASDYGVAVLNMYDSRSGSPGPYTYTGNVQDQLVFNPVPEPTTMLLLGLGLVGLAGIRRKIKS